MGQVTLSKKTKKVAKVVEPDPLVLPPGEMVDIAGKLQEEIAELEKKLLESAIHKKLKTKRDELFQTSEALMAYVDNNTPATEKLEIDGPEFHAKFGAKGKKRTVDNKEALFEYLGEDDFILLAQFALKDIDDYLNKKQAEQVCNAEHSGKRSVKIERT